MSRKKIIFTSIITLVLIIVIIAAIKAFQIRSIIQQGENFRQPPSAVSAVAVVEQDWLPKLNAVGTVRAEEGITIVAERAGRVEKIAFQSGAFIRKGDLLIEQDDDNERAELKSAQAQLRLAESSYERIKRLRQRKTVSESELERAQQTLDSTQANVESLRTTLERKKIRAPFSGKLGIRQVDLGQDLQAGTEIVSLHAQDKLNVDFTLPQRWLNQIATGIPVQVEILERANSKPVPGVITAIDSEVNDVTRSIDIRAQLENTQHSLLPGMAVNIDILINKPKTYYVIPITSVIYAPFGDSVFIIEEQENTLVARQQFIRIAERRGDFVAVTHGLNSDDRIVSTGAFKLFNGQEIVITQRDETKYELTPTPDDT